MMRMHCTDHDATRKHYACPPLGNGDLSLQVDFQGTQPQEPACGMTPGIRRAGFRYDSIPSKLVPFGWFDQQGAGLEEPLHWSQTLDVGTGILHCTCDYASGTRLESEVFCHFEHNIIAVRKRLSRTMTYAFRYHLSAKRMQVEVDPVAEAEPVIGMQCQCDMGTIWCDSITLLAKGPALSPQIAGDCFSLKGEMEEADFFIAFGDGNRQRVVDGSFESLRSSHVEQWQAYWDTASVTLPSETLQKAYYSCQYHLKISSTKWSVPIGIFDTHWHGRYFGFDEYFIQQGLLSSGHQEEAEKIAAFRAGILPQARRRVTSRATDNGGAFFPWQTVENGLEGGSAGFWLEHIFHNCNIAIGAFECYSYSNDRQFLEAIAYPLLYACAQNCLQRLVYRSDNRIWLGKVTDMERLGTDHENAFMTTCSVIQLFRLAAQAAEILGRDEVHGREWTSCADGLSESLPHDGAKYLPYPDCPSSSIGQLGGLYPYPVLEPDDPYALAALDDFLENETKVGNMYVGGSSVCAWYVLWEVMALLRAGRNQDALKHLEWLGTQVGCFHELFEIYEREMRPWFTTAEGAFVYAVNSLLLPSSDDVPPPAWEAGWTDFAFRLPRPGGEWLQAESRDGAWATYDVTKE